MFDMVLNTLLQSYDNLLLYGGLPETCDQETVHMEFDQCDMCVHPIKIY